MEIFNDLILVSKESILRKHFNIDMNAYGKLSEKEKEIAGDIIPTEDEKNFMTVFNSTSPQLARLQRKMSVCLEVEVLEFAFDFVIFTFAKNKYRVIAPKNAYRICQALENGNLEGLQEMGKQGCIWVNENPVNDIKADNVLQIDEIQILKSVVEKFFFQTFIV